MKSYHLSKSKLIAGLQCPKRLWLQVHKPDLIESNDGESLSILNGNEVGEMARRLNPGTLVKYGNGLTAALNQTARLVSDTDVRIIHEATFCHDGILVRVDMLVRTDNGWGLTEVKGATSVKPNYIPDVAIQAWVLKGCGLKLKSMLLMHVNKHFVYQGDGNYDDLMVAVKVKRKVNSYLKTIPDQRKSFATMLLGSEPAIGMGSHCITPYACEFCEYCQPETKPKYPVTVLPNLRDPQKSKLISAYADVRDIPESQLTNPNHRRVWRASRSGKEYIEAKEIKALKSLTWPRYYLDFETIAMAVPRWHGVRPYTQVPFQWSCHIQHKRKATEHVEFLDISGGDPRRACAEALVRHIGSKGMLIAYNASFEKRVIRELAALYADLSELLLAMNERFVDLLPITRKSYYHPSQMGSWSIKAVLPALVPELNYANLDDVQNGADAQLAWMQATSGNEKERDNIANHLLAYCKLDTLAMVKIVEALLSKAKG